MGALVLDLFCPLRVSLFQSFVSKILMSRFSIALFKTVALEMPLVTSCDARVIEGRSGSIHPLVEDETVISCANPILISVWVPY